MPTTIQEIINSKVVVANVRGISSDATAIEIGRYPDGDLMITQGDDRLYVSIDQVDLLIAALTAAKGA